MYNINKSLKEYFSILGVLIGGCILMLVYIGVIKNNSVPDFVIMLFLFLWIMCMVLLGRKYRKKMFFIGMIGMFIVQIFCGYFLMVDFHTWDIYAIYKNSVSLATGGGINEVYFARYPNQLAILYILTVFYKIVYALFGSTSVYWGMLLNIAAIDMAIYFSVCAAKYIIGEDSYIVGILCVFFAPFYLWTPIFYTDTLCMPIETGSILLLFYAAEKASDKLNFVQAKEKLLYGLKIWLFFLTAGILMGCGFLIKGSLAVLIAAAILYLFFKFDLRRFFSALLGLLSGICIIMILWSGMGKNLLISSDMFNSYQFPTAHWIMMGLHGKGNFNSEDVNFTESFETYDEKSEAAKKVIIDWTKEAGAAGVAAQMYKKATQYGWNYGTYYAERYLGDYGDEPVTYNILHEFILTNGKYHKLFRRYTQGYYLILFFMAILSYFIGIKKKNKNIETVFLQFSLIGFCLFFMLWETHPRYMLHFSPIMLIAAACSICSIINKFLPHIDSKHREDTSTAAKNEQRFGRSFLNSLRHSLNI